MEYRSDIDSEKLEKIFDIQLKALNGQLLFGAGYLKRQQVVLRFFKKIRFFIFLYFLCLLGLVFYAIGNSELLVAVIFFLLGAANFFFGTPIWMEKIRTTFTLNYREVLVKKNIFGTSLELSSSIVALLVLSGAGVLSIVFSLPSWISFSLWVMFLCNGMSLIFFLRVEHNLKLLIPFPIEKEEFDKITCVPDYIGEPMALKENGGGFYYLIKFENTVTLAYNRRKGTKVKLWIVDLEQNPGFAEVLEKLEKRLGEDRKSVV